MHKHGGEEVPSSLTALWLTWDDGSKWREIASLLYILIRLKENIAGSTLYEKMYILFPAVY